MHEENSELLSPISDSEVKKSFFAKLLNIDVDELQSTEAVQYTSYWDGATVTTSATLDTSSGLIYDIEQVENESVLSECQHLESEKITLRSGDELSVVEYHGDYYVDPDEYSIKPHEPSEATVSKATDRTLLSLISESLNNGGTLSKDSQSLLDSIIKDKFGTEMTNEGSLGLGM